MNLLPKTHEEFTQVEYWNTFFKKRGKKNFEWYGEYSELCSILLKYIKVKDNILIVGCGNSTVSMCLYDSGYRSIINIDISHIVIKQMSDINASVRPDLVYEQMDATQMTYSDGTFSVILDKGTLDALMPDTKEGTISTVNKYFKEITRVLRNGGRYICISLLQEHILRELLSYFPNAGFMFRIIRCQEVEAKTRIEEGSFIPVFAVVATKFTSLSQTVVVHVCFLGRIVVEFLQMMFSGASSCVVEFFWIFFLGERLMWELQGRRSCFHLVPHGLVNSRIEASWDRWVYIESQRNQSDEELAIDEVPTCSHYLESKNSELNSSQEVYESCDKVPCTDKDNFMNIHNNNICGSDEEKDTHSLFDDENEYYHCILNYDSSDDESANVIVDCNEPESPATLRQDLSNWALRNNITHKAINELFSIFLSYVPKFLLPKDARILLHTPRTSNCTKIQGGDYLHLGVEQMLKSYAEMYVEAHISVQYVDLSLNIGGLPLSRASSSSFWPISNSILKRIQIVGIYYGYKKPESSNELMEKFIDEITYFINSGFMYDNNKLSFRLTKIVCDAPAKSFVLYTKGHTWFSSCSKCTIVGKSVNRTTCFPYTEVPDTVSVRTTEDFRRQTNENYHKGASGLLKVPSIGNWQHVMENCSDSKIVNNIGKIYS